MLPKHTSKLSYSVLVLLWLRNMITQREIPEILTITDNWRKVKGNIGKRKGTVIRRQRNRRSGHGRGGF